MLPSPIIEGTLPAFYLENGAAKIVVPFSMSRAVNRNEITGFKLKIKNLQGSSYLKTLDNISADFNEMQAVFSLTAAEANEIFSLGSFYKAQLAYVDNKNVVGYYSTVGIIKYTAKPTLSISGLSISKNNTHNYVYTGVYSQKDKDPTEKEYAYRFVIRDNENQIIEDSGYLIHNSSNDVEYYESSDVFSYTYDLVTNNKYSITYSVKTNNGLEIEGPSYRIIQKEALPLDTINKIFPIVNQDNGFIEIFFNVNPEPMTIEEKREAETDKNNEKYIKGSFILARSSEDYQYSNWETIVDFSLFSQKPSSQTWRDFTIEQGKKYKYSIQQYSKANQLYSKRLTSKEVMADFEDSFLYDGSRQLKIKFNPKVSSFKKNIFEAKVDTLGSKYPFIFRNGQVEYREFPISGLISYLMDEQSYFGNNAEQFSRQQREFENIIYSPFTWIKNDNPIIEQSLQRNQYQKEYKFLWVWDNSEQKYLKWEAYLDKIYKTDNDHLNKYHDYSNYDRYFDPNKQYYTRARYASNDFDIDSVKLATTNEVGYNLGLERDFKMDVLNWLTNGEPKLFRSPTEGNFIVRLMNVSLTPNDQLGRMLHTFNSTAYEIADFNYETLKSYGFLNTQYFKKSYFKIQTIPLITNDVAYKNLSNIEYVQKTEDGLYYATGSLMPGATTLEFIEITDTNPSTKFFINGQEVIIGASGHYKVELPITSLSIDGTAEFISDKDITDQSKITYGYYTDIDDTFSYISNAEIKEVCGRQFIGEQSNIADQLIDIITAPTSYYLIRAFERDIIDGIPDEEYSNNIDLYRVYEERDSVLGYLYRQATFAETEFYDSLKSGTLVYTYPSNHEDEEDVITERHLWYRTSSNKLLFPMSDYEVMLQDNKLYKYVAELDIPDADPFVLLTAEDDFDEDNIFIKDPSIGYIYDKNISLVKSSCLIKDSYSGYEELYSVISKKNFSSNYARALSANLIKNYYPYSCRLTINDSLIDLSNIKYWDSSREGVEVLTNYSTTIGVWTDLTYTIQITNYDLSKDADLIERKNILDAYIDILSYDRAKDYALMRKLTYEDQYYHDLFLEMYQEKEKQKEKILNDNSLSESDKAGRITLLESEYQKNRLDILTYDPSYEILLDGARNGFDSAVYYSNGSFNKIKLENNYKTVYEAYVAALEYYIEKLKEYYEEVGF